MGAMERCHEETALPHAIDRWTERRVLEPDVCLGFLWGPRLLDSNRMHVPRSLLPVPPPVSRRRNG
jgi:hypothetical protein